MFYIILSNKRFDASIPRPDPTRPDHLARHIFYLSIETLDPPPNSSYLSTPPIHPSTAAHFLFISMLQICV